MNEVEDTRLKEFQYVAGSKHDYLLVSFDADFDHTDRGRKTPGESISLILNHSAS